MLKALLLGGVLVAGAGLATSVVAPDLVPFVGSTLRKASCTSIPTACIELRGRELEQRREAVREARSRIDVGERAARDNDTRLAEEMRQTAAATDELARLEVARRAAAGQDTVTFRDRTYSHAAGQIAEQMNVLVNEYRIREESRAANQEDRRILAQARGTLIVSETSLTNALARLEVEKVKLQVAQQVENANSLMAELQGVNRAAETALASVPASPVRSVPELIDQSRRARPAIATGTAPAFDFDAFLAKGGLGGAGG